MNRHQLLASLPVALGLLLAPLPTARADDDAVQTVIGLVSDKDKDVRAIGLEQVRDEVKGEAATRRFADLLPKLAADAQVGLLGALAGRGDAAAKPAVLDLLKGSDGDIRSAAIRALGPLGNKDDVPRLAALLGNEKDRTDAADALTRLPGNGVNSALCKQLTTSPPAMRAQIVKLLVARHAIDSVPALLASSKDSDAKVRAAALDALGQLAGPELIAKLAREIIDAKDRKSREEAEKSLAAIARRDPKNPDPALPLLKIMAAMSERETNILLPALGRVGGSSARNYVDVALANGKDMFRFYKAVEALCNWPDGSVAQRLYDLRVSNPYPPGQKMLQRPYRETVIDALIRVAPLPDGRPDSERLAMLKKAMELADSDSQRATIIKRARAIRSLDTFRFVAPYMDDPKFRQIACETVVELAHHKELRQPNKAEFNKALDKVIALSKNPELVHRAKLYQNDQTWVEKQLKGK